jgi:hypothetical protein
VIVEVGDVRLDLTDEQVEGLRSQLAVEPPATGDELIDAAEVGRLLGCSRDHVYAHADELGAVRIGVGPRPRLRFDPAIVSERLSKSASTAGRNAEGAVEPGRPRRRRSFQRPEGELLPIRGDRP